MRYQQIPYSCGAAATVNALRCFGMRIPERVIRSRANTTQQGTSELGIVAALESFGLTGISFNVKKEKQYPNLRLRAMNQLSTNVSAGHPVIICTQNFQHWVTIIGKIGDRFVLIDPANTNENKKENSVHVLSQATLSNMWKSKNGIYSGIVVKKLL